MHSGINAIFLYSWQNASFSDLAIVWNYALKNARDIAPTVAKPFKIKKVKMESY
ncbi:MAG: hypothetical protein ACE5KT_08490 [Methanosarcinales archaeon]